MAKYKIVGTVDFLGVQAMLFPWTKIDGELFYFANNRWMVERSSRKFLFRSFDVIDHRPRTIMVRGQDIPLESLSVVGTRVMAGNVVVGSIDRGGKVLSNDGGSLISNDGGGLLAQGGKLISNDGGGIVGTGSGNFISHNGSA